MFKKLMMVSIILLAVLSISAVSAAENITDTSLEISEIGDEILNENVDEIEEVNEFEEDVLSAAENDDKLGQHDENQLSGPSIEQYIYVPEEIEVDEYYHYRTLVRVSNIYSYTDGTITVGIDDEQVYSGSVSRYKYIYLDDIYSDVSQLPKYGLHNVTVSYEGSYYDSFTKTYSVDFTYPFYVYHSYYYPVEFGEYLFEVNLPQTALDMVLVEVNGKSIGNISLDANKRFKLNIDHFNLGANTVTVTYGDALHPKKSKDLILDVSAQFELPSLYIVGDEEDFISVIVPKHEDGYLILSRTIRESQVPEEYVLMSQSPENEIIESVRVVNGTASIKIPKSTNNIEYYLAEFIGYQTDYIHFDVRYTSSNENITISVPSEINYGDDLKIKIENNNDQITRFHMYLDGKQVIYDQTLQDSRLITIPTISAKMDVGVHEIIITSSDEWNSYFGYEDPIHFYKKINVTVNQMEEDSSTVTSNVSSVSDKPTTQTPVKTAPKATKIDLALKTVKIKKSAKKIILKATLKINGKAAKSKWVVFKFNGKKFKAKTDSKGIAKLTIKKSALKKLKAGKKVKYQVSYSSKLVKKTGTVKK